MNSKKNKIIAGLGILISIVLALIFLSNSSDNFESEQVLTMGGDVNSIVEAGLRTGGSSSASESEAFFVRQINQLEQVTLNNTGVLENPRLLGLTDNTVTIPSANAGRPNPFAPIDARLRVSGSSSTSSSNTVPAESNNEATNSTSGGSVDDSITVINGDN